VGLQLIAAISLEGTLDTLWVILQVLIGVGLVIFVHELGHFVVAKMCGVKCEKFYLGFDVPIKIGPIVFPRTLGKFRWGETEYGIGIIPLGGYVKMLGQDDNPANAQQEAERIRVAKQKGDGADDARETEYELDPRSYPAKSVPQRMAIISAGVVMNLIFAVIFAVIAYRMGVPYTTCEIGSTAIGSPAWVKNLPLRDNIIQIGADGRESAHLRFDWDLRQQVALGGQGSATTEVDVKLRSPQGQDSVLKITPSDRLVKRGVAKVVTLGVRPANTTTLDLKLPAIPGSAAAKAVPEFKGGDRIIGVNGQIWERTGENEEGDLPAYLLDDTLATNSAQPLSFVVERWADPEKTDGPSEQLNLEVPANPLRRVGLILAVGPIEAIREGSPAAKCGFQVGDTLQKINGEPLGDPLVLGPKVAKLAGQEITVLVTRGVGESAQEVELRVTPEARFRLDAATPGSLVGIESIGVAFPVTNTVVGVESGSPAQQAGLQAGDELRLSTFVPTTPEVESFAEELFGRGWNRPVEFDTQQENWAYLSDLIQYVPDGTDVKLEFVRGSQSMTATLRPIVSTEWFNPDRGLRLIPLERIHTAESWSEALDEGLRRTRTDLLGVVRVVKKLVTGEVSPKLLGGPIMIFAAAGSEASRSVSSLLLFLTMLSANLAVLNFLPIPALDGGHIVFLLAEAVTGKPVDERLQGTLTLVGVICLLGLMVFVVFNDIRLFLP
jgi:regulator of sigma E protease